jgi:alpha-tubulin suppressor-like RCC1 family protein
VKVSSIASGATHSLALTDTGSVLWYVQRGGTKKKIPQIDPFATFTNKMLILSYSNSWGSFKDGKLGIVTEKDHLEPIEISFFADKNITHLAAGCDHSVAISRDGDIYTWGFGQHSALGLGDLEDSPTPKQISRFQSGSIIDVQCGMDVTFVKTQRL